MFGAVSASRGWAWMRCLEHSETGPSSEQQTCNPCIILEQIASTSLTGRRVSKVILKQPLSEDFSRQTFEFQVEKTCLIIHFIVYSSHQLVDSSYLLIFHLEHDRTSVTCLLHGRCNINCQIITNTWSHWSDTFPSQRLHRTSQHLYK